MRSFLAWFRREEVHRVRLLDADALFLCVVACFWYFVAYLLNPATPSPNVIGWWGFFDQGLYYRTTMDLAGGHLLPSTYWYGYPLLGAFFYWLMPLHPYFIPNLVLILLMVSSYFAACRLFFSRLEAWVLVILAIFADSILRDSCLIIPWNTLPEYAAFYLCFYFLIFTRATLPRCAFCAFFCGLASLCRFSESEILALVYLFALLDLPTWGKKLFALAMLGIALGTSVAITLGTNFYFYHSWRSPYMGQMDNFSTSNYPLKIYQFLFDGYFITGPHSSINSPTYQILESYWPFIFILPGAVFLWRTYGWKILGFFLGILCSIGFYLCYNPTNNVPYFWTYGSVHYLWWTMPWLGFITYLSFRRAPFALSRPLYFATLFGPLALSLPLGWRDVVLATSAPGSAAGLNFTTSYAGKTAAIQIESQRKTDALDLRVYFKKTPSFPGSDVAAVWLIKIIHNDKPYTEQRDFMISQSDSRFDFSFISHNLHLHPGDRLTVLFSKTDPVAVDRVEAIGVAYSPFGAIRHFVQNDLRHAP